MYTEDELVPISALAQLAYCLRRCALFHLEGAWEDNRFTIEGRLLHENVHEHRTERRRARCALPVACGFIRCGWVLWARLMWLNFSSLTRNRRMISRRTNPTPAVLFCPTNLGAGDPFR